MTEELRHLFRHFGLDRSRPVAIWCIDRPDASTHLRSDPMFSQLPIHDWHAGEPDMVGGMPWMSCVEAGVYVEMSKGPPTRLTI